MNYNEIVKLVYSAKDIATNAVLKADVKEKSADDFVTAVDFAISDFIKGELLKIAPDVAFVTEEESQHVCSGKRFVLDPIDGTTNLIRGGKQVSISLGYYADNCVQFGIVFNPFYDEIFFSIKGKGAHFYNAKNGIDQLINIGVENYNGGIIKVSDLPHNKSIVEFGANVSNKSLADKNFALAKKIFTECLDIRRNCSSALAICYVADGRIDGYFERSLKVWDYCAATLILEEAGGVVSQWNGAPLPYTNPSTIVVGNKNTYDYLLNLLGKEEI